MDVGLRERHTKGGALNGASTQPVDHVPVMIDQRRENEFGIEFGEQGLPPTSGHSFWDNATFTHEA